MEVSLSKGKGNPLTGNLGDVMKNRQQLPSNI
ncbi:MAG: hypothetical protein R2750_12145 [Bacteroidales bacterium]